jgi:hypothetical protein
MSRQESPREDLLREATALVERAELTIPGCDEPVVVGFRRDESASFFFGEDAVYQFNAAGELRRAYVGGLLYKAEAGNLVALHRERTATETTLVRHELTPAETASFLEAAQRFLIELQTALSTGNHQLLRAVPPRADVPRRIAAWLQKLPAPILLASRPNVERP